MNVHPAAGIHDSPRMEQGTDNFLQFRHFAVFQFWGIHFHLVGAIPDGNLLPSDPVGTMDAGIVDKPPCFSLVVGYLPRIVGGGRTGMGSSASEQGCHSFRRLLAG